jgi:hypothetical protein
MAEKLVNGVVTPAGANVNFSDAQTMFRHRVMALHARESEVAPILLAWTESNHSRVRAKCALNGRDLLNGCELVVSNDRASCDSSSLQHFHARGAIVTWLGTFPIVCACH